jgi:hypothetical protein
MRLVFLTAFAAISSFAYAQLQVEEFSLEPLKSDSAIYLFQKTYSDHLSNKSTPIILYFCPIRNYSKQEYSEKISVLKASPFLKNLDKKVKMFVYYFKENDVNDRSGVQYKTDSWVNESTCFFLHFEQPNLERLAENFPREYKIEETGDAASTKVILFDANRCFPDVPTRLVAYARAIQESAQPNYSDSEINKFQKRDIEDLKIFKKSIDSSIEEINKTNGNQEEQLFNLNGQSKETNLRIDQMEQNFSDADILLQAYYNLASIQTDNDVTVSEATGSGCFLGIRKQINSQSETPSSLFFTSGISIGSQRAGLTRDSLLLESIETDRNGTSYVNRSYYNGVKQSINTSTLTIPLGIQYQYKATGKQNWKLFGEGGVQLQFIQNVQSLITEGTLSTAGVYAGFDSEIRNVADLGFTDNQALDAANNSVSMKNNAFGFFLGLQFEYRLSSLLHLNIHARAQKSGNWLSDSPSPVEYAPVNRITAYGQNPYQFGLGLTYSLKQ